MTLLTKTAVKKALRFSHFGYSTLRRPNSATQDMCLTGG